MRTDGPGYLLLIPAVPLMISATLDLTRHVRLGEVSGSGMLSVVQLAIVSIATIVLGVYPWRLIRWMFPYAAFLGWVAISVFWSPAILVNSTQNAVVYVLFAVVILFVGSLMARYPEETLQLVDRGIHGVDWIALGLAVASLLLRGFPSDERGWFIGPRSFALLGVMVISWHLARWYYGERGAGIRAWCWLTAIALSLSRTATAAAALSFALAILMRTCIRPRDLLTRVPLIVIGLGVTSAYVLYATPFHERFVTGDLSIAVGDTQVNASGRMQMWEIIIASGRASPLIGQGLGSSQVAIFEMGETIGHPHNDYLRLWHDLGFVGLGLFLLAVSGWFFALLRSWRLAAHVCRARAAAPLAAMFALLGFMLSAFTDNAIVYPFVMGPLGVLLGAGLGAGISCAVLQVRNRKTWGA